MAELSARVGSAGVHVRVCVHACVMWERELAMAWLSSRRVADLQEIFLLENARRILALQMGQARILDEV